MSYRHHIWYPYTQMRSALDPRMIKKGRGVEVWDEENRPYLDLVSSWWVNVHGHCHPAIASAIAQQAGMLDHVMLTDFIHQPALEFTNLLCQVLDERLSRVFLSDNGSTAVEVALKIALQYWINLGQERQQIICFEGGYHGDTFGSMSVSQSAGLFCAFSDYTFEAQVVPLPFTWIGDVDVEKKEKQALEAFEKTLEQQEGSIAALIAEPLVQGAMGMRYYRPEFLNQVMALCRQHGILVIFDEVMTGFGRTGKLFAYEYLQDAPDILCLSKGITGGFLPLGVTACQHYIYEAFLDHSFQKALPHGHSYTANPIICAAALACLKLFEQEDTLKKIAFIEGVHQEQALLLWQKGLIQKLRIIGSICAFNISISMDYGSLEGIQLRERFLDNGLILRPIGTTLHLIPPACISKEQLIHSYRTIERVLSQGALG